MTTLVLVNAVYFKGQWKNKFNPDYTKDMPFHVNKDTIKNVPTMYKQGKYKYGELANLNAKFIVIPYKVNLRKSVIYRKYIEKNFYFIIFYYNYLL